MDADASLYEFDDKDEKEDKQFEGIDMKAVISAGWIDPPKRERKKNYNESDYYRDVMAQATPSLQGDWSAHPQAAEHVRLSVLRRAPHYRPV